MRANRLHWILWPLLVLLLLFGGLLMYRACGLQVFGLAANYCHMGSGPERNEIAALTLQVRQLEAQLASAPVCTPAIPLPRVGEALPVGGGGGVVAGPAVPGGSEMAPGTGPAPATPVAPTADGGGPSDVQAPQGGTAPGGDGPAPPADAPGDAPGAAPQGTPEAAPGDAPADAAANPPTDPAAAPPADEGQEEQAEETPPPGDQARNEDATNCPTSDQGKPPVVLALDHSKSMGLPAELSDDAVAELDAQISSDDESTAWAAKQIYDGYVAQPGRKRLDELKDAVRSATSADRDFGLISFAGCEAGIHSLGKFGPEQHTQMLSAVDALAPRPATPLAEAIRQSVQLARQLGPDGRVLLVSDGIDTCGGDPCAAAASAGGVTIDVLAVGEPSALSCIAEATGGRVLTRSDAGSFETGLTQALSSAGAGNC